MRITISGPIGSGKTTACDLLSKRLGVECVVSGKIFRQMAVENGLSLSDFGKLCEADPKYDKMLDGRMVDIARENDNIVLEGRLVAHMLTKEHIPALRVYLDAPLEVRVGRVVQREGDDREKAKADLLEREECEALRYRQYYGIDIRDKSIYDMVIDTSVLTPEEIVERIVEAVNKRCPSW